MRFKGFIGPTYQLQSVNVDCQRCINYYPEADEAGTGKEGEAFSLVGTPGLRLLQTIGTGPIRGVYAMPSSLIISETLFVVSGNTIYSVDPDWNATTLGTLLTNSGPVSMSDNATVLVIVDGDNGYYVTLSTSAFAQITDPNFLGADTVTFQDSYLIFNKPGTQQFYTTTVGAFLPFDPTFIATKEGASDNIIGLISDHLNVYLFGSYSSEVWYDSGATFPFQRIQGAYIPVGCLAAYSIQILVGMAFWLGCDQQGRGIVFSGQAGAPQRISTHALETQLLGVSAANMNLARAWTYQQGGHAFYCLNVPGLDTTWCYDTNSGQWHERASLVRGSLRRHQADCHAFAYQTNVVGDYESGNIYALDPLTLSDNGNPIQRVRAAPHLTDGLMRVFHSSFQLDMEVGVGLDGTQQGTNPQAILQWSDDGGHKWSNEHWAWIGKIGATRTRVIWRRLGNSRDRVYRVTITDPVKVTLIGAELNLQPGAS